MDEMRKVEKRSTEEIEKALRYMCKEKLTDKMRAILMDSCFTKKLVKLGDRLGIRMVP